MAALLGAALGRRGQLRQSACEFAFERLRASWETVMPRARASFGSRPAERGEAECHLRRAAGAAVEGGPSGTGEVLGQRAPRGLQEFGCQRVGVGLSALADTWDGEARCRRPPVPGVRRPWASQSRKDVVDVGAFDDIAPPQPVV